MEQGSQENRKEKEALHGPRLLLLGLQMRKEL